MRTMMMLLLASAVAGFCQDAPKPAEPQAVASYVWVNQNAEKLDVFMQDVAAFVEKNDHYYPATVDGQGARVRPIKYALVADNRLLFVITTKKEMYAQLLKNPNVELSRAAADGTFIRYKGKAVVESDPKVRAKVVESGKKLGEDSVIFAVEPEQIGIFVKGGQAKTKIFTK